MSLCFGSGRGLHLNYISIGWILSWLSCFLLRILHADPIQVTVRKASLRIAPAMLVTCHSKFWVGWGGGGKKTKEARDRYRLSFLFVSFYSIFMKSKYINIHINMHTYMYTYHAYM